MREDVVTPATGRLLSRAGLEWVPEAGDWCAVLGNEHLGELRAGLWLVTAFSPAEGLLSVLDAAGQWPMARVPFQACTWLPSAGKLKLWLRARGYRVATGETEVTALGTGGVRYVCRASRTGETGALLEGEGTSESEAVAGAVSRELAAAARAGEHPLNGAVGTAGGWIAVPDAQTRRLLDTTGDWIAVPDAQTRRL